MFVCYEFPLLAPLPTLRGSGYRLYAALCELAGLEEAQRWHDGERTPLHQYLYGCEDNLFWRVHTLDKESDEALADPLSRLQTLPLDGLSIPLAAPTITRTTADAFLRHHLAQQTPPKQLQLRYLSPTAFRSAGHYEILPQPAQVLKSAAERFNVYLPQNLRVESKDLYEVWQAHCLLNRFRLQSANFSLKNVHIPGFMGDATVTLRGSEAMRALNALLFAALAIVGCGVKTALGMGAVAVSAENWTLLPPCDTISTPH